MNAGVPVEFSRLMGISVEIKYSPGIYVMCVMAAILKYMEVQDFFVCFLCKLQIIN